MFVINKENLDETRIGKLEPDNSSWDYVDIIGAEATSKPAAQDPGATQRVFISDDGVSTTPPTPAPSVRKSQPSPQRRQASAAQRANAVAARKKREQITILSLCAVAAVLLIAVIIVVIATFSTPKDNGKILNNVFAAGVNLSGMTPEEAKAALHAATDNTYSQLDMTVQVLDTTIVLSAKDTGAKLNVDAVAEAAYNYGRSGSDADGQAVPHTVSILPYLTLDTGYIRNAVNKLGKQYSTTLSQTTYEIQGTRPAMDPDPETVDTTKVYQTLYITIGTAEYGLNTDRLYEQIMDAYNINLFQVAGECSVVAPEELDCELLYEQFCSAPVDAAIDPATYVITPEVYGYGITLNELKAMVAEAEYGAALTIPMRYIAPDITASIISKDLFKDTLSSFQTNTSSDANWNTNLTLVCQALNGVIIKSGEEFSFNEIIGEPTTRQGYKAVSLYVGKSLTSVVGGGISQVASTLYNCALLADLDILERHAHTYAPSFISTGLDAQIYYGSMDLRFRNNTEQPIRIEAAITDGFLQIALIGTDTKTYTVDIIYKVTNTKTPGTESITLSSDNAGGYANGDVLTEGITGYNVSTYKCTYDLISGMKLSEDLIAQSSYAKRNTVVAKIETQESTDSPSVDTTDPVSGTEAPTETP